MTKQVIAHKCDFCSKVYGRKVNAKQHEKTCKNNPERHNCITCVYGGLTVMDVVDIGEGHTMDVTAPACHYHGKLMSDKPYQIDCKEFFDDYGILRSTPGTCEHYEYKGYSGWRGENKYESR